MNVYTATELGDAERWRQEAQMGHALPEDWGSSEANIARERKAAAEQADPVRDELAAIDALLDSAGIANLGTRLDRLRNLAQIARGARDMVALYDDVKAELAEMTGELQDEYHERLALGATVEALRDENARLRAEAGKAGRNPA